MSNTTAAISKVRCKATKANGQPCLANAGASGWCFWHDPARAAERAAARRKGGHNSKRATRYIPGERAAVAIQTPGDVLQILEDELNGILQLDISLQRARTVAILVEKCLKALEVAELAARLESLESAVFGEKVRANNGRY